MCVGGSITLNNITQGGNWSSGNNEIATVIPGGIVTGVSGGQVTIYYSVTDANNCTRTVSYNVTVNPLPNITINPSGPTTFCSGGSVTLTASGANTYAWSPSDGLSITTGSTVIATPETTTTYTVTGTNSFGCIESTDITITVNPSPRGIMHSYPAVCSGDNSGSIHLEVINRNMSGLQDPAIITC